MNTFLTEILNPLTQFEIRDFLYLDAPLIGNIHISITNISPWGGKRGWSLGPGFYLIVPPGGGEPTRGWGPGLIFIIIMNLLSTNYNRPISNNWCEAIFQEAMYATIHVNSSKPSYSEKCIAFGVIWIWQVKSWFIW